jgi:hypothetical protein
VSTIDCNRTLLLNSYMRRARARVERKNFKFFVTILKRD